MLSQDFLDLLELFNQHEVRYLIVGGHAVSVYTEPRYTKDLDLWIERNTTNASKILKAIHDFGFSSMALTVEDFTAPKFVVQLGVEPVRIDLLTDVADLDFADCWTRRLEIVLSETRTTLIGLDDLIKTKERAGRPRDLADLYDLRRRQSP